MEIDSELFKYFRDKIEPDIITKSQNNDLLLFIKKRFNILILPWITTSGYSRKEITFLEIGCGDGKYAFYVSKYVGKYIGIDIRRKSISEARKLNYKNSNCEFKINNGHDLKSIKSDSITHVFSYQSFQHMEREVVFGYLKEIIRVLKQKGEAKVQLVGKESQRNKYLIRWKKLGYYRNSKSKIHRKISLLLLKLFSDEFKFPVFNFNNIQDEGWELGSLINYKSLYSFCAKMKVSCIVIPSYYNSIYSGTLGNVYWLIIYKNDKLPLHIKLG